jgi:hypothetical protein
MNFDRPTPEFMPPIMLSTLHVESIGRIYIGMRPSAPASGAWPTANKMFYNPFMLNRQVTVYRLFWCNGATVGTNNLQMAVYDGAFARIINGTSTLSAGANALQFDNITDTVLGPGRFYMALWCNGTTATVLRSSTGALPGAGYYGETNASGPQATGTPVAQGTTAFLPLCGLALRATP